MAADAPEVSQSSSPQPLKLAPEQEKLGLEQEKLRLEIAELRRPFWQRPAYISATIPLVIAVVGLIIAWSRGFFDNERLKLQEQRAVLQAENRDLLKQAQELKETIQVFRDLSGPALSLPLRTPALRVQESQVVPGALAISARSLTA